MPQTLLPQHYYLSHARELVAYIKRCCGHLIDQPTRHLLDQFEMLERNAQCLLVRIWTRKPALIPVDSLNYPEIEQVPLALTALEEAELIQRGHQRRGHQGRGHQGRGHQGRGHQRRGHQRRGHQRPLDNAALSSLTKRDLTELLQHLGVPIHRASKKAELVEQARVALQANEIGVEAQNVLKRFVCRQHEDTLNYLLFLFFGDLRHNFSSFVMRDLGVMTTRKRINNNPPVARYDSIETAQLVFRCQTFMRALRRQPEALEPAIHFLFEQQSISHPARDALVVAVGKRLAGENKERAIRILATSQHPEAIEKRVRLAYQLGEKDAVKKELERLMASDLPAASEVFVSDFYARKYEGKRTSIYTDIIREDQAPFALDEAYVNNVEAGVMQTLRALGASVWFVENTLWRSLFGLTLWEVLFNRTERHANEFDQLPLVMQNPRFFAEHQKEINEALKLFDCPTQAAKTLTARVARHYGYPNGLFRWRSNLLEPILALVQYAPQGALAAVVRSMAKQFSERNDGYPDLMVIQDQQLRFVEVKAPGDTLRPNQLVAINRLRAAGLPTEVQTVTWSINPEQTYSVVDIETTGGRNKGNSITEIAVVKVRDQVIIDEWSTLINPSKPIPHHIVRLTGINNQMVANAPRFSEIADELAERLDGTIFVAHNVSFDYGFIKAAYERLDRPFRHPKLCTVKRARAAFPGLSSYSLGNLTQHFDITLTNHHRALDDARATAHLLRLIQSHAS